MNERKPVLSISLLASNRPDTIPKCLDSLKPVMEELECELIIVDTSGNPEVHELLLKYTDKVETFQWCNDFSAARNAGLKKATGEWFLFLDDDEWFVEYDDLIRFFKSGEYRSYGCANYMVRSFYDRNYEYYGETMVSRMIKLEKDTRFESKIHEYLYPVHGACRNLSAKVYHSGYIYETEEERWKHFERNAALLLQMIEDEPDNLRWQTQLAQEYRAVRKWKELEEYCRERLEINKRNGTADNPKEALHMMTFYTGYILALSNLEKYDETLQVCQELLGSKNCVELGIAMVYLNLAETFYKKEQYEKAIHSGWEYLKTREQLEQKPKELMYQNTSLILNETLEKVKINKIYSIIICADIKLGNLEMLYQHYDKLLWDEPTIYVYADTEVHILNALIENQEEELLFRVISDGFANQTLCNRMINVFMEWGDKDIPKFQHAMNVLSRVDAENWYVYYARIWNADDRKDKSAMDEALRVFYQMVPNIFIVPGCMYDIVSKYDMDATQYWKEISADKWKANVKEYLAVTNQKHLDGIRECVGEVFLPQDWHGQFFELCLLERDVERGPKEPWNLSSYVDVLQKYVDETLQFYGKYYKEEVFLQYPEVLPESVQAAICIMEYLELESQDKAAALSRLKDTAAVYPEFADAMRGFLQQYPELEIQRAKKQRTELRNLRNQIVTQVKDLLEQAKEKGASTQDRKVLVHQALEVTGQLKQMVPDDLEVLALGLEARLAALEVN